MYRIGVAVLICLLVACTENNERSSEGTSEGENTLAGFSSHFAAKSLPYQLADTSLLKNKDTTTLAASYITSLVPDTTISKIFGKTKGVKFTPLAKVAAKEKEAYFIVKATAGAKKAALLMVFDKAGNFGAAMPFLVPDDKTSTSQISSLDKSYTITKAVSQRGDNTVAGEGREVLAYDAGEKRFSLIMTDLLNDVPAVLINPLDTFPKTNKLSGDYFANKQNLIAVRDGRHANQILVYIHTENSDRTCIGELKGEFILTSSTTAVYKQGGDPCGLSLAFSGNSVSINEESGCGNYRGLDCPFSGKFTRKKEEKPKETNKKASRTKPSR
jgi:hypothetical protein